MIPEIRTTRVAPELWQKIFEWLTRPPRFVQGSQAMNGFENAASQRQSMLISPERSEAAN